jgi:hypothetical protein
MYSVEKIDSLIMEGREVARTIEMLHKHLR